MSVHVFVPAVGHIVANRYALTRVIGRGGMGEVWQAHDRDLDSPCAIKFILPHLAHDRGTRERFVREARAVAKLSSPHVVQVLGVGEEEGLLYLALQLLEGETLRSRLLRIGKLHPSVTLELAEQVSDALENAHRAGIVHRDLKPENIWCWSGNKMFAKVLDFGVAKSTREGNSLKTATGALLGTPQYMSPEQAHGNKDVDHRSDLWAFALIIVECLTGKRAFDGPGLGHLLTEIVSGRVPPLEQLGPELPEGLGVWWARALARDPRDRFQSATELVDELRPHLATPSAEWLTAQRAGNASRDDVLPADASARESPPVTSSLPGGQPLQPPHVTVTFAPGRAASSSKPNATRETPSLARPAVTAPRVAAVRRLLAATGLVALAILVILISARRFIDSEEKHTSSGPVDAAPVAPSKPSTGGPAPLPDPGTEPTPQAVTHALNPPPVNSAPQPKATTRRTRESSVASADALTKKTPDTPPVTSKGNAAATDGDDPLGLRGAAQETSASEEARRTRLREFERQLGLSPEPDD